MIKSLYKYIFNKSATLLNREQLGVIKFSDKDLTEEQKTERNAVIASNYEILNRIVEDFIKEQKDFMANICENESQLLFSRGSVNGLSLVLESFTTYKGQHEERIKPEESYNKFKVT